MNLIQKYSHIVESHAYIPKIFVVMFLLPMIFLISIGIYSTPKLLKFILACGICSHYHHSHTKLSNKLLLICIH